MSIIWYVGQILGILGLVGTSISFLLKTKFKFLLVHTISDTLCALSFIILGFHGGLAVILVAIVVELCEMFYNDKGLVTPKKFTVVFLAGYVIACAVAYTAWYDLLVLASSITYVCFVVRCKSLVRLKLLSLVCCVLWLVYGICVGHFGAILEEVIGITTIVVVLFNNLRKSRNGVLV